MIKKIFIPIFLIFFFLSIQIVNANNIYVDDNNIDEWYDSTHVKTIQEGITNSTDNDTIYVYNGTYNEDITINKNISLLQENKSNNPYIIGKVTIGSFLYGGVNVSGFDITKDAIESLRINKCYYVNISYCNITSTNCGYVLYMRGRYCNISNNNIYSSYIFNTVLIMSCLNSGDFDFTGNNIFYKNNINGNNATDYGIYLADNIGEDILIQNTIQYASNDYQHFGLYIEDYITNCLIYNNNFIGNKYQACGNTLNTWNYSYGVYPNNTIGGNYWSDGNTTDNYHNESQNISGSDGIVDKNGGLDIYYINNAIDTFESKDYYPLLHPYGYIAPIIQPPHVYTINFKWQNWYMNAILIIGIFAMILIFIYVIMKKFRGNKEDKFLDKIFLMAISIVIIILVISILLSSMF
jgi:hypothetical protein